MKVYEALAQSLRAHGTEQVFGLAGDGNLFVLDAWVHAQGGRYVACAHEANGMLAALGYAQVSGRIGVATATHGPGLTNAFTALVEGVLGRIPAVFLCGDTPGATLGHLQKIDQREVVKATGAGFVQLHTPDSAGIDLARAFRRAALEQRPIVFNMPADIQELETEVGPVVLPAPPVCYAAVECEAWNTALDIIASAKRPLIIAGRGAIGPEARSAILRLAKRIDAPIATTLRAVGLFNDYPFAIGVFGTLSRPVALDVMGRSDCAITFGASLTNLTLGGDRHGRRGNLLDGMRVVQILTDAQDNERSTEHEVRLIADPALAVGKIIATLDAAEIPPSMNTGKDLAEALQRESRAFLEPLPFKQTAPGTIDFIPALRHINRALPAEHIVVTDTGRFLTGGAWTNLAVQNPRHFVPTTNFGPMGSAMGEAIGAACAAPNIPTLLIVGDGGFMLGGLPDLATVAHESLRLITVVCNDGAYGAEYLQLANKSKPTSVSLTSTINFAAVAHAMGIPSFRIQDPATLDNATTQLSRTTSGPLVIELCLDPMKVVPYS